MSNSGRKRLPPVDGTTRELYLYSGNQCAFTGCTEVLLQQDGNWNCEVAHIYGVKPGSARGNHNLTNEELRESSNLVLMCPNHHNKIDNKKLESIYTVDVVRDIKAQHEAKFRTALRGLGRIIDSTAEHFAKRPENLCALDGFCTNMTEDEIRENVVMAAPFVDALLKQPAVLRDVISLVLVHGRTENHWGSFHQSPSHDNEDRGGFFIGYTRRTQAKGAISGARRTSVNRRRRRSLVLCSGRPDCRQRRLGSLRRDSRTCSG